MEPAISRGLNDKLYEKRKTGALELEKLVRECHIQGDFTRISHIIDQLVDLFANPSQPLHCRNGGLIGLAAAAIALGVEISPYMDKFIEPLLRCFTDQESRIRYFACESMYNIAKVSKGEILVYFNPIFDSLSKLAADSELSVKNGAELLDRLLKDVVAESAPIHFPQYPETEKVRQRTEESHGAGLGVLVPQGDDGNELYDDYPPAKRAFSLAHFMPLLAERIYVVSPFTRSYLVSWIQVLDSVPDLELVTFLPVILDGLLRYLSDPTEDVRVSTENLLREFLQEVRDIAIAQKRREEKLKTQRTTQAKVDRTQDNKAADIERERLPDITVVFPEKGSFITGDDSSSHETEHGDTDAGDEQDPQDRDTGAWIPGQGVSVDHASIVEILIQQLESPHDEIQQSTALVWIAEFLDFTPNVMVPFTPRLIPCILPNLAHHVPDMQKAAVETNQSLFSLIQNLPSPSPTPAPITLASTAAAAPPHPTLSKDPSSGSLVSMVSKDEFGNFVNVIDGLPALEKTAATPTVKTRSLTAPSESVSPMVSNGLQPLEQISSRPGSPSFSSSVNVNTTVVLQHSPVSIAAPDEMDPFDYQATVNKLTIQFLSEHEETRVNALKWLLMLHQKAPRKILAIDDGTFPALLKTLSDASEEVVKHDLQLLAQISSSSEESYFREFMHNLLELFSTDRRLLDLRGSLIIRQLCISLSIDKIYRSLAEILEKEEDLEFASTMVQKLNIILITSPELSEFRRRLKNLDSRDGQALFSVLYRSWCHNAVAVLSLCLLAQAYEHASNLLQLFADLDITVQLLVQIDKLVQLIESPVFTYLRLQLLEPEKYPYLFKCLYGLLMLLPQSAAFISLRNRLNAVSSLGFLHVAPRSTAAVPLGPRSKIVREEMKWQELLSHFRAVQVKHEKSRRIGATGDTFSVAGSGESSVKGGGAPASMSGGGGERTITGRPQARRKASATGPSVLSPLNPKSRASTSTGLLATALNAAAGTAGGPKSRPMSPPMVKPRRSIGLQGGK